MLRGCTIGDATATSSSTPSTGSGTLGFDPVKIVLEGLTQFIAVTVKVISAISDARRWTISEQTLGERFIDQVPGVEVALFKAGLLDYNAETYIEEHPGAANFVDRHFGEGTTNYTPIIKMAQKVMTLLFGVRITNDEDLDALDDGPAQYYMRPDKTDIPQAAVERAVYLKQNFFPISTYNTKSWDLSKFASVPYVAPIPGIDPGTFFNGDIPGGGKIVEGIIQTPGAFTPAAQPGGGTVTESLPGSVPGGTPAESGTGKTGLLIIAAVAALLILSGDGN